MHKLLLFICLLFSVAGHAKTETQEKVKVLNLMKKYTKLISCSNTFGENDSNRKTTIKDVFAIERDKETGSRTYFFGGVVLHHVDWLIQGFLQTFLLFIGKVKSFHLM